MLASLEAVGAAATEAARPAKKKYQFTQRMAATPPRITVQSTAVMRFIVRSDRPAQGICDAPCVAVRG
jgi:hypothetical protein